MMQAVTQMSTPSALGDVKILDFSRVLAGPFATMMLADLGATVTKVERPGTGDETRSWGPPYDAAGEATYFQSVNRNKRSVVLDLSTDPDRHRALALTRASDVVLENFRPGVMERLGLGYEQLCSEDPSLIYCSITGFGSGSGAQLPGYDLLIQALGGLMSITGPADGGPQKVGVALVDVLAGLFATVGILAALRHRDATGEGQRVDVDLFSALLAALVNQGSAFTIAGAVPGRLGNSHPSIAPYELLATREGELVVAVGNDRQFAALCEVLGLGALAADGRYAHNSDRVANRAQLRADLEVRLSDRPAADWARELTAVRVPAGVVNDVGAAFGLAQSLGLEPIVSLAKDDGGTVSLTRNPIRLSRTPPTYRSAPPSLPQR
jgi:crotonobetainyl-CoA:carnitine CoA-transferase CaiB-like acyl-CoA transferase